MQTVFQNPPVPRFSIVAPVNGPLILRSRTEHKEYQPIVLIDHSWDGETWYRTKYAAEHMGGLYPIITHKEALALEQLIDDNEPDGIEKDVAKLRIYANNLVIGVSNDFTHELWARCENIERDFMSIVMLGVIGFPTTMNGFSNI